MATPRSLTPTPRPLRGRPAFPFWWLALLLLAWWRPTSPGWPPLCLWLGGHIERVYIPLSTGENLPGRVYLPPCYDQNPTRRYPLLLLLHGQGYTDSQWDYLGLDETADRLIPSRRLPPFVAFMPRETTWDLPPQANFDRILVQEALPWLENRYRLRARPRYRAVGGISRGGAWALRLGLMHWQIFGAVGGHSAPLFAGDGIRVHRWLDAIPQGRWPRIYLDIGDADQASILKSIQDLERLLAQRGIPHVWRFNVGRHDDVYWQRHLPEYLRWYTCSWGATETSCPGEQIPP